MGHTNDDVELDPLLMERLDRLLAEKPPLTEPELDALCDVVVSVRLDAARTTKT
jgi:hypothetical protein